jgi:hypothetical protein
MALHGRPQSMSPRLVTFVIFCLLVSTLTVLLPQAALAGTVSGHQNDDNVATSSVGGSDDFDQPDGPLGANWTDISAGGLTVSSQAAAGTNASTVTGDIWTAVAFSSP